MQRFECLKILAPLSGDALAVSSAGAVTLEWHALRPGDGNFRVRTLGLCSSIALGMALGLAERRVIALDGDGSLLMNLCSLPTIARMKPKNLLHVVFDNEVYEASGSKRPPPARARIWSGWRAPPASKMPIGQTRSKRLRAPQSEPS